MTQVHTSLDGIYWTLEAKYFYYAHGPLARVEIGEHNIQGVDYYYTLQGWIKGVNSPEGTFGKDGTEDNPTFNTDEFAYTLHYFEGDYTARGTNAILGDAFVADANYENFKEFYDHTEAGNDLGGGFIEAEKYDRKSLYNGNVAAMTTSIAHFGRQENGRATQSMNYRYDQLHRIAAASSKQWNPATGVWESQTVGKAYQTSYQYDRNGNIQKLFRRNQAGDVIDNLKYSYDPVKKNQLYRVTDQAANVDNADFSANGLNYGNHLYEYDEIGNLIKNGSDGIKTIIWNIQGKVEKVVRTNATITYRYDASGNRITKQVATTTTNHVNLYLRDASGNVMAIYEKKTDQNIAIKEIPIYGGSRLGQYRPKDETKPTALGQRIYEFSNHLGNVLVTLSDNKVPQTDGTYKAIVLSASDYYPFGMAMKERTFSNENYRYGFNGQEKSDELDENGNSYTAEFWQYSATIARRWNVDPVVIVEESGYATFSDNPIKYNDPNGDCAKCPQFQFNAGISFGTDGFKANFNFTTSQNIADVLKLSYGFGATYHSNFYTTGKSGLEFRNSFMATGGFNRTSISLGTNIWSGLGEMREFSQTTGILKAQSGKFSFQYENDGTPFQWIGIGKKEDYKRKSSLADGGDSFRTAAGSIGWGNYSLSLNLFTGKRNGLAYQREEEIDREIIQDFGGNEKQIMNDDAQYKSFFRPLLSNSGQYGERYTHGFVMESKNTYRYGGLTFNRTVGGKTESWGLNSEWFRHGFQNKFAHDFASYQRQFPMLSNTFTPIRNLSTQLDSEFTTWGK